MLLVPISSKFKIKSYKSALHTNLNPFLDINVLVIVFSDSFEYLCYGSTIIVNTSTLAVQGSTLDSDN